MEKIINYMTGSTTTFATLENIYELKVKNKLAKWLVKFAVKRKWISSYCVPETVGHIKRYVYSDEKIFEAIGDMQRHLRYQSGKKIAAVMIGRKQMDILDEELCEPIIGNMQYCESINDGRDFKVRDIRVIINPMIDGIVMLTEDMLRKE